MELWTTLPKEKEDLRPSGMTMEECLVEVYGTSDPAKIKKLRKKYKKARAKEEYKLRYERPIFTKLYAFRRILEDYTYYFRILRECGRWGRKNVLLRIGIEELFFLVFFIIFAIMTGLPITLNSIWRGMVLTVVGSIIVWNVIIPPRSPASGQTGWLADLANHMWIFGWLLMPFCSSKPWSDCYTREDYEAKFPKHPESLKALIFEYDVRNYRKNRAGEKFESPQYVRHDRSICNAPYPYHTVLHIGWHRAKIEKG